MVAKPKQVIGQVDEPSSQRATLRPPFDPEEFARESERVTVVPPRLEPHDEIEWFELLSEAPDTRG